MLPWREKQERWWLLNACRQSPYHMECRLVDVNEVCNQEKKVPLEWITRHGSDVGQEFLDYALPADPGRAETPHGRNRNSRNMFSTRKCRLKFY